MPGNPKECREHAKNCVLLAGEATSEQARETFESLAQTWLRLATDLEKTQALIDEWGEPDPVPTARS